MHKVLVKASIFIIKSIISSILHLISICLNNKTHHCRTLRKVGVTSAPSEAGYYIFPDFEVCRNALKQRGIITGYDMCRDIMEKKNVAVSRLKI